MNLLTEPILSTLPLHGGSERIDLPTLLARYGEDQVADLLFLRPHQLAPWHAFCVQVAALAMHRVGRTDLPDDADSWRSLLRGLTLAWPDDAPWHLVVDDPTVPAFMQPPVPKGTADPHDKPVETPDDLDVLVTSKNHGVKQSLASGADEGAWAAALVTLQTSGGYLGSGKYGVARMNGGFATRPQIGLVPRGGPGARWRRDVSVLLAHRDWALLRLPGGFAEKGGHSLLWCLPWDGSVSLGLEELDPWFVEVCRRVRLRRETNRLVAYTTGSQAARVAGKAHNGNVGDPWIPIELARDSVAFNTAPHYPVMAAVLLDRGKWLRPLLLEWHDGIDEPGTVARFDVLVRGQGTTEGHHVRDVPIDERRRSILFSGPALRDRVALQAERMIGEAQRLRLKVVKPAVLTLIQARDKLDFGDNTASAWAEPWLQQADSIVDEQFFDHLFAVAEDESKGLPQWALFLRDTAVVVFDRAVSALPVAGVRRLKAIAVGESLLHGAFLKEFGGLLRASAQEMVDGR